MDAPSLWRGELSVCLVCSRARFGNIFSLWTSEGLSCLSGLAEGFFLWLYVVVSNYLVFVIVAALVEAAFLHFYGESVQLAARLASMANCRELECLFLSLVSGFLGLRLAQTG